MVFFCGSTHTKSEINQKNYGNCVKESCEGRVNLMDETSRKYLFCCIPRRPTQQQVVECVKCGASVKSMYYDRETNTIIEPPVDSGDSDGDDDVNRKNTQDDNEADDHGGSDGDQSESEYYSEDETE